MPKRPESRCPHKNLDTRTFKVAWFTTAKKEKQTEYPPMNLWIDKYNNGILFSHKRMKNWYELPCGWTLKTFCTVKEASHRKSHVVWFYLCEISRADKSVEADSRLAVARDRGVGAVGGEWQLKWTRFVWGWAKHLGLRQWWRLHNSLDIQKHWIVCFKGVNLMPCELCLTKLLFRKSRRCIKQGGCVYT